MINILEKIINHKKIELVKEIQKNPISILEESIYFKTNCVSAKKNILDSTKTGIIAEFKRISPLKGPINTQCTVEEVVADYEKFGASCISVLTDVDFFGGSISDLQIAKKSVDIPILRKEFIVDEYQIYQTKAIGADLILLIAEVLTKEEIEEFAKLAKSLGLEVLLEIHLEEHLNKICSNIDIVGINNRDLRTFKVDLDNSIKISKQIPNQFVKIAESGISSPTDLLKLKNAGFNGFLIGENFMKEENPGKAFEIFTSEIKGLKL